MRAKRGSWVGFVMHPTFETLMAITVMVVMLWFIHGLGEKTAFEKRFLATDLALLIDTIPAMPQPGNLWLLYVPQKNVKFDVKYGFTFSQGKVEVVTKKDDGSPGAFSFTPDPGMPVEDATFAYTNAMIVPLFLKQGKRVSIKNLNQRPYSYSREFLTCDGPAFRGALTVSPVHVSGAEAAAEQSIAEKTQGLLGQQSGGAAVLAIKLASAPTDAALIKAYVNAENTPALLAQSQRLGCEIADAVLLQLDKQGIAVAGVAVVPINPDQTASDEDRVLANGKVGVLLEIEAKQQGLREDITQQRGLAFAIKDGVDHA